MQVKYLLLRKGYLNITSTLFSQISEDLAVSQQQDLELNLESASTHTAADTLDTLLECWLIVDLTEL